MNYLHKFTYKEYRNNEQTMEKYRVYWTGIKTRLDNDNYSIIVWKLLKKVCVTHVKAMCPVSAPWANVASKLSVLPIHHTGLAGWVYNRPVWSAHQFIQQTLAHTPTHFVWSNKSVRLKQLRQCLHMQGNVLMLKAFHMHTASDIKHQTSDIKH